VNERELPRSLASVPIPDGPESQERVWQVVRAAYGERETVSWPRRHARLVVAAVVAAAVAAVIASPPGRALVNSIRDAVGREKVVGVKRAAPALLSLPAPGRLLVTGASGPWIVNADGSKRHLGAYASAGWSPRGLFEIATRGRQLVAVDPKGNVRWTITRARPVRDARWSPDGYRIAYLAGSVLHVVAGDATGDHTIAGAVAPVAPAWKPGASHVLTFSDRQGEIRSYAADQARLLWRARPAQPPRSLSWSADGRYLLAVGRSSLTLYQADGTPAGEILGPGAAPVVTAAFAPDGRRIAFVQRTRLGSVLWLYPSLRPDATAARRLFAGAGVFSDLAWSPDSRWLLLAWQSADQWLFIRAAGAQKLVAVSDITRQFNPGARRPGAFPTVDGWCCTSNGRPG
jgi:hypothetical protein